ncbi:GNAT family N-acetyltransferase [Micromonospora sp. C95]|uniref:GNAT family N-acetyltransferase n=1 Tax=Micromonospora sp. C95 TaxID=2824882 RepID=UPI001B37380E|nr:GNAT family N-acetyltransferase [Micromonospora sp. C95]MBQ1027788.1 GNAT family N-acetyltransferase [Micromonospora sp. C95]
MGEDKNPVLDLGSMLRALRRQADLSQRELAERSGVPQSTVARIESGRSAGSQFGTVQRLVRAAGGALRIAGPDDRALTADEVGEDVRRDEAGRRYPAHLDVRKVRTLKDWPGAWWAHWYSLPPDRWPLRVPEVTYDLDRDRRDERRLRERLRDAVRIRRLSDGVPEGCWRFVAELPGGDVVGELRAHERNLDLLLGEDLGDRREVVLDGVLVAPRLRLLGIGRRLVARLMEETRQTGPHAICATAEFGGIQFLLACGYRIEWSRPQSLRLDLPR